MVGKEDIRIISPNRKEVLLYKDLKDVTSVTQGHKNSDHIGIIIRDTRAESSASGGGYIGYVFKCQSDTVADDILTAISQSFIQNRKNQQKSQEFSCDHCPMVWYDKLCRDVNNTSNKKTQSIIFRRIESLNEPEQRSIMDKFFGVDGLADRPLAEQNQFLMDLLRSHFEVS